MKIYKYTIVLKEVPKKVLLKWFIQDHYF